MPRVTADVDVGDFLAALGADLTNLPPRIYTAFTERESIEMMVHVDQSEIDDEASMPAALYPDVVQLDAGDFREALRALLEGDLTIAGVLFARALEGDEEASTVAEEEIRRAVAARQPKLARAA